MAGAVFSRERKLSKAGEMLDEDAPLEVRGKDHPWVSRGGIKLDHGLTYFGFDVTGAVALDVGSSTGGFTDVLLSRGAAKVYAVDVGTNQLAWKLRQDPRVMVHEQTNARKPLKLAKSRAKLVALIKPQFEAGREEVGKGGVVRDPAVHERVCGAAKAWVESQGWAVLGITPSPITGPEGNIEFLLGAQNISAQKTGDS
jgi:23S rRNA (cytidine1920-2'-O)/16S rRNA (cytidine1409-2'-O)-methyltransferase